MSEEKAIQFDELIFERIIDIGCEMLKAGGEIQCVEQTVSLLCSSYGAIGKCAEKYVSFQPDVHKGFNKHTETVQSYFKNAHFSIIPFCGTMYLQRRIFIMKKVIYDKNNGLWYELQGDYYLPCLKRSEEKPVHIGIWGQQHLRFLKENKHIFLSGLQIGGELNRYLTDIDKQAEEMFKRLVKQIAEREGVTEKLKADNQMEWVQKMNNIRNRATEIVNNQIIFN